MSKAASKFGCFLYEKETPKKVFLSKWTNWNQRLPCGFCTYYHFMFWIPVSIGVFQIHYQYQKYPLSSLKYWNLHGCAHVSIIIILYALKWYWLRNDTLLLYSSVLYICVQLNWCPCLTKSSKLKFHLVFSRSSHDNHAVTLLHLLMKTMGSEKASK